MRIRPKLWFLTALSAVLQVVIFPVAGPLPGWRAALAWVAIVPFLSALLPSEDGMELRIRDGALLGYFCGVLWYLGTCYWVYSTMHIYGGLSVVAGIVVMLLFCLYLALYHALFGTLVVLMHRYTRAGRADVLVAIPLLWIAVELARARVTGFPWNLLGYSQIGNVNLTPLAPLGGAYIIGFIVIAANAIFASFWILRRSRENVALVSAWLVIVAGITIVQRDKPVPAGVETAVMLQPNLGVGSEARGDSSRDPLREAMGLTLTGQQRAITLWPESPAPYTTSDPGLREAWTLLASRTDAPVIAGAIGIDHTATGRMLYNSAAQIDPNSGYVGRYSKIHLVPFGEFVPFESIFSFAGGLTQEIGHFQRGTSRDVFRSQGHAYGTFLCYESIFGDEVREFVRNGAEVLVNLSDDGWYGDTSAPFQHINMARMRAIENRRWILRDTNNGITGAIDPYGNLHDTIPRHVVGAAVVHFNYATEKTFYTLHGDLFAYLCAAIASGLFAWAMVCKIKGC